MTQATDTKRNFRTEIDSLGKVSVEESVYYGAQTKRACDNFRISGTTMSQFPMVPRVLAMIKKASARTNFKLGDLPKDKAEAIQAACDRVIDGDYDDQFPIDMIQGGAGTSANMNINEVIANIGLESMGYEKGEYNYLDPNNDVNLSQSTNDVYPTAIRLAILSSNRSLRLVLESLAEAFEERSKAFRSILKLGRTQLQDAVPMTLGQEFGAFAAIIRQDIQRIESGSNLLREINLGGTAIGTGITADPRYQRAVVQELAEITGLELSPAADLIAASWDVGALVTVSGALKRLAINLSKISNDLRLLSSGPNGGVCEIILPAKQPGSSIMPGKVNPVIPEVVSQVAFEVIGADMTVTMAAEAGQLQLNAMEPVMLYKLLTSINLLANAVSTLEHHCVRRIEADEQRCRELLEAGSALATILIPLIGYQKVAELVKEMGRSGTPLKELVLREQLLPENVLEVVLNNRSATQPNRERLHAYSNDLKGTNGNGDRGVPPNLAVAR